MFSDPFGKVTHFGWWAGQAAMDRSKKAALDVLADALERCREQDMRTDEVHEALKFLASGATRQWPFHQFWRSLGMGISDNSGPEGRWQNVHASLNAIRRVIGAE